MGISGLLPLLSDAITPSHIKEYAGKWVGIDAYVWLHQATYACAYELCLDLDTDKYVTYFMKRVNLFLHYSVRPYVVFDGGRLPSKRGEEALRAAARADARRRAHALLRDGKREAATELFRRAVDVTPRMAARVMRALDAAMGQGEQQVRYMVAPYEADAQLAYLAQHELVSAVVTEDSDLLAYGVGTLLTKLKGDGACERLRLADVATLPAFRHWSPSNLLHMCILSGCDYLPRIPSLGIKRAYELVRRHRDIQRVLRAVRQDAALDVPADYERAFARAEFTFRHQRVFDPRTKQCVSLTPIDDECDMSVIGALLSPRKSARIMEGKVDPSTFEPFEEEQVKMVKMTTTTTSKPSINVRSFFTKVATTTVERKREKEEEAAAAASASPKKKKKKILTSKYFNS